MAINTIKATMQMRRGAEADFDQGQMSAGEWAVSTDTKYVRMCFMPGLCLRMATYESFEADLEIVRAILLECQNIQVAVEAFQKLAEKHKDDAAASAAAAAASEIAAADSEAAAAASEANAKQSETDAKTSADNAAASETAAADSEAAAKASEEAAKTSEDNAASSEAAAEDSADKAESEAIKAKGSADDAADSASAAADSARDSSDYADMSRSYAIGTENTVRDGDETDNSKYYSEQSKNSADESKLYLEKVEQAGDDAVDKINNAFDVQSPEFFVDISTGHIYYQGTWVDFVVMNGHLEWGLVA